MRPTLAQSARLLGEADAAARTRGAALSYEICLARCVAPITPLAAPQVALGRDYALLGPVLRRLARALREPLTDKRSVDLVIAAARALAAVAALLVFAQRCDVHADVLAQVAAPLRTRCTPALVAPLLAVDLRVVAAARDALDQIVLLRAAHATPWLDLLLALRSFRLHHAASDRRPLLEVVLARVAAVLRPVFVDVARHAHSLDDASDAQPATQRTNSWLRRRSSIRSTTAPAVHVSALSSFHGCPSDLPDPPPARRSRRFIDKLRPGRRKKGPTALSGRSFSSAWKCEENGAACVGCPFCSPTEPDSFDSPRAPGMRFSKRSKRFSTARQSDRTQAEPISHGSRVSVDSVPNGVVRSRKSLDITRNFLGRRDSLTENGNRRSAHQLRKRRGANGADVSASLASEVENGSEWKGRQLGVGNHDISAAMHIYERLLSRFLLPEMQDRCQVIDDLHRLVHPLLTGVTAGQRNVDPGALRCVVANAFLAHGTAIYPALLALVFRPAPSAERTEQVRRHLSLQPHLAGRTEPTAGKKRNSKRSRTADFTDIVMGSVSTLKLTGMCKPDTLCDTPTEGGVCLPNSDCDTDSALRCTALLTLLVRNVPDLCNPRLPLMTGTTNSAYWHSAEALVESSKSGKASVTWSVERLVGAVDSLFLLNASLPDCAQDALKAVTSDGAQLDYVVETCMRSVCASGCRLARIDARKSAPSLSDTGVIESARAWVSLSKLPSQSVLWPSSPAYSSAIVFVAHLARRTAVSVYHQRRLQEIDTLWHRRNGVNSGDPSVSMHLVSDDGAPETFSFEAVPTPMSGCTVPSTSSRRGEDARPTAENGKGAAEKSGNDAALIKCLQECIGTLVSRNGSKYIVHDMFRTLLYILGCELRGAPTRASFVSHNDDVTPSADTIIPRASVKASALPSRVPFFTRSAHAPPPQSKDSFTLRSAVPRLEKDTREFEVSSEIDVVDVQSLNRLSLDESDMSGLLVGNIAVDGSRDSKLLEIAAKAQGTAVASWFTGLSPPSVGRSQSSQFNTSDHNLPKCQSTNSRESTFQSIVDAAADPSFGISSEFSPPVSRTRMEVIAEHFDELSTAVALVINAVTTAAASEGEDVSVSMHHIAADVKAANCAVVTQLHKAALTLLKGSHLGSAQSVWNAGALVRQVRDLRAEVKSLRNDVEFLKVAVGSGDENWRRSRWPLRSFPRSNGEANYANIEQPTSKRGSFLH